MVRQLSLHIVIEDCMMIMVLVKQPPGVVYTKVFEVQETVRVVFANELYESEQNSVL